MQIFSGVVGTGVCKRIAYRAHVTLPLEDSELARLEAAAWLEGSTVDEICRRIVMVAFFGVTKFEPPPKTEQWVNRNATLTKRALGRFECAACNHNKKAASQKVIDQKRRTGKLAAELVMANQKIRALEQELGLLQIKQAREQSRERAA